MPVTPNSKLVALPIALEQSRSPALNLSDWYEPGAVGKDRFKELDCANATDAESNNIMSDMSSNLLHVYCIIITPLSIFLNQFQKIVCLLKFS